MLDLILGCCSEQPSGSSSVPTSFFFFYGRRSCKPTSPFKHTGVLDSLIATLLQAQSASTALMLVSNSAEVLLELTG